MFVRIRVNTWNLKRVVAPAVKYYTDNGIPVVLTFMAYFETPIPEKHKKNYIFRKRTINDYWAITTSAWKRIMGQYADNILVYSCGKIEGELGSTKCKRCGNCVREYHNSKERMRNEK